MSEKNEVFLAFENLIVLMKGLKSIKIILDTLHVSFVKIGQTACPILTNFVYISLIFNNATRFKHKSPFVAG